MAAPSKKSLEAPDERVMAPGVKADVVEVADSTISRNVFDPGTHCPQISLEGKPLCLAHHTGYVIEGTLHIEMQDGSVMDVGANDVFDIPAGHDGWVTGERPWVAVTWAGFRSWAPDRAGERILVTLLFTDIVQSTSRAIALGDQAWRELLAHHNQAVRSVLDRFRGREVSTTGDGFLAAFDGAARAIQAAMGVRDVAARDGLQIRAGVHSGEAEVVGDDLRGITVHEAARVAAAAEPGEILVTEATRMLASGTSFTLEPRGSFDLKGLPGPRTLYAVATQPGS